MSVVVSRANAKSASIYAEVIRADGTKENKGLVAYYHKNPLMNFVVNTYIKTKELLRNDGKSPK